MRKITYTKAKKIQNLRSTGNRKYTQQYLANKFGISQTVVSEILNGKMPTPTLFEKKKFGIKESKAPKSYKAKISTGGHQYYVVGEGKYWNIDKGAYTGLNRTEDVLPPKGNAKKITLGKNGLTFIIYDDGRIWSCSNQRIVKTSKSKRGYQQFCGKYVHRLVLTHFDRPPEEGEVGRHLDGNPAHNHISNLAWGSGQDNVDDMLVHETKGKGKVHSNARLTEDQAKKIIRKWEKNCHKYGSMRDFIAIASAKTGVTETSMYNLLTGATWKHLERKKVHFKKKGRTGSADTLTEKQKGKIRQKFEITPNSQNVFVSNAAKHFGVSKYAVRKIIGRL